MTLGEALLMAMRETNNYFKQTSESGEYGISGGAIALKNGYLPGQWIAITGSKLNDGVYCVEGASDGVYAISGGSGDNTPPQDEDAFTGTVYGLGVPPGFIRLCEDIKAFDEGAGRPTAYTSESVANLHSWSRGTNPVTGTPIGWAEAFSARLAPFRRMFAQIDI